MAAEGLLAGTSKARAIDWISPRGSTDAKLTSEVSFCGRSGRPGDRADRLVEEAIG